MRCMFLYLLLFSFAQFLPAQSDNLTEDNEKLMRTIGFAEDEKTNYSQRWSYYPNDPYLITLSVEEEDKKRGKSQVFEYQFNLADLDNRKIREHSKRGGKIVSVDVDGKQNFIKVFKEGKLQNFQNEINIFASRANDANEIKKLLHSAISSADELDKQRLQVQSFDEMGNWMQTHITDYTFDGDSYEVSMKPVKEDSLMYEYYLAEIKRRGSDVDRFTFNLADLDPNSLKIDTKGKTIEVEATTENKLRFVTISNNGKMKNYDDKVIFQLGSIENARDLTEVLRKIIPEAKSRVPKELVPVTDYSHALDTFQHFLTAFEQDGDNFQHAFEPSCITTYQLEKTDSKSHSSAESYEFNFGDLDPATLFIKVNGKDMFVVGSVKGSNKFVRYLQDSEQKNFENEVAFRASDVVNAKELVYLLKPIIEGCGEQQQKVQTMARKGEPGDWLTEAVDGFKSPNDPEYQQQLSIDKAACSMVVSTVVPKGRRVEKFQYEVALKDLDLLALSPQVSGSVMSIGFQTKNRDKLIRVEKDGVPEKEQNSFEIRVLNIEEARSLINGFKELVEGCNR